MKKEVSIEESTENVELFDNGHCHHGGPDDHSGGVLLLRRRPGHPAGRPGADVHYHPQGIREHGLWPCGGHPVLLLVLFAAVTSSIALTESAVSTFEDELGWSRERATALIGLIMVALGSLSALGYGPLAGVTVFGMQFLDFFDFPPTLLMMPIAAIAICLLVSRVIGVQKIEEEVTLGGKPLPT